MYSCLGCLNDGRGLERIVLKLFGNLDPAKRSFLLQNLELLFIAALIFVLGLAHPWVNSALDFDRAAIASGQWWRLVSCNLVHLSVNHMLLNVSAFVLATILFKPYVSARNWYLNLGLSFFAVGLGILIFDEEVSNYVGLSGALYGVLAFGALTNLRRQALMSVVVYIYIIHRVWVQHSPDFDVSSMKDFIGGNVIVSSHLYGLVTGHVMSACLFFSTWQKKHKEQ